MKKTKTQGIADAGTNYPKAGGQGNHPAAGGGPGDWGGAGGQNGKQKAGAPGKGGGATGRGKRDLSPAVQALLGMYQQRYYQAHREAVRNNQRQYMEANRPLHRAAGARLRAARKEKGLSQRQLGALLGVGKGAVCHWEQGRVPYNLATLAAVLPGLGAKSPGHVRTLHHGFLHAGKAPGLGAATRAELKPVCTPGKAADCPVMESMAPRGEENGNQQKEDT